jgi:N-ethylmaleimide reductase
MWDSDPLRTFAYLATELNHFGLGYLHVTEPIAGPAAIPADVPRALPVLRKIFKKTLIANGGYDVRSGNQALAHNKADLIAFGMPFLANPDLPLRYRKGAPLNPPDISTFYGGEEKGYIDYPALREDAVV